MVDLIVILLFGGIIGGLASIIMRTDPQKGAIINVAVGIVGALLGGLLLAPLIIGSSIIGRSLDLRSLLLSLVGAVILLAIMNVIRRGRTR